MTPQRKETIMHNKYIVIDMKLARFIALVAITLVTVMSPPGLPGKDKDAKAGIASRSVLSLFKLVVKLCKICYNNCIHNYKKRTNCLRLNPKNKKGSKKGGKFMDKKDITNESRGEKFSRKFLKISKIFCIVSVAFLVLVQFQTIRKQDELINQQDELIQQMDENLQLQQDVIQKLKEIFASDYREDEESIVVPASEGDVVLTTAQW